MGAPDTKPPGRPPPDGERGRESLVTAGHVGDLTHDVRNSLASIVAFGQLLRTDPALPPDLSRQADLLVTEAERLAALVDELVRLARGGTPPVAAASADAGAGGTEPGRRTGPARVLVLDDEPAIREFLARVLRRAGYEPLVAADGAAALDVVRGDPPDAILCDHRMAGMSGTAFHAAVAAIEPALARRFVFMSGDVLDPELREFALDRGIVLLAKPFDIDGVTRTIARVLAAWRKGQPRG